MAFTSLTFIAFITIVVLLCSAVKTAGSRSLVLLAANLVFIGSHVASISQVAPLLAFLLLGYLTIEALRRSRSLPGLWAGLLLVIAGFVVLKRFGFLGESLSLPFPYLVLGLSYVLFRVLHLMIDAQQGELSRPIAPLHFFNYTCNFLSFIAGPIQRYPDHARQREQLLVLDEAKVFGAFARVIKGFVKLGVVSAVFNYVFENLSVRLLDASQALGTPMFFGLFVTAAVCYTVYLYANFAGYMDIVIGVGSLTGQELPENFNQPFLARNFLDFWSRWHMSLSDWFKTYLFNPLLKLLATRFTSPRAGPYLGVVAFFVTFLVMGVWHGTTAVFVVYGLLMGAGASINKLWQVLVTKRLGKKRYRLLADKPALIYLSRGMTFAYFALALTCLWVDMPELQFLAQRLGAAGLVACYGGLALAAGMAFAAWDGLSSLSAPWRSGVDSGIKGLSGGVMARNLALGAQVMLIVAVASFFHKAPEFVYRAF